MYMETREGKAIVAALYDTGANVSVISPMSCRKVGLSWIQREAPLETIGPKRAISSGYLNVMVSIGSITEELSFEVVQNGKADVLISKPDGSKFGFEASGPIFCQKDGHLIKSVVATCKETEARSILEHLLSEYDCLFARSEYDVGLIKGIELRI